MEANRHFLFSYGTLQLDKVQYETYGRLLKGEKETLRNYKIDELKITDSDVLRKSGKEYHPIAIKTGNPNDFIEGTIFEITDIELKETDRYEVKDYYRVLETFVSGRKAWIYVSQKHRQPSEIVNNIIKIKDRINKACKQAKRNPEEIKLLLATKTVNPKRIKEAIEFGETLIAENKVQEVKEKFVVLKDVPHQQHFIGHLQTNKIKEILKYDIKCIHSLDRFSLAQKLHNQLIKENKTIDVLVQINTSEEESKFGITSSEAVNFIKQVAQFNTLKIKGLMTIGVFSSDFDKIRGCFKKLKCIQQEVIEANIPNVEMKELSMGMSNDLEIA
ncbi:MAG: YggS family pyridoxal phosphate-dependent enzyme, partial [Chitinophagales bacterium]